MSTTRVHHLDGQQYAGDLTLVTVTCPNCHMTYAIPYTLERAARADPNLNVRCPAGHIWHYAGRTLEQKLEDSQRDAARLAAERDQAQASAAGYKRAASRARNERDTLRTRVRSGQCPCCDQTFPDLARHMHLAHPDYPLDTDAQ